MTATEQGARLTLEGGSAPRRTLAGRPVNCGVSLELQIADGRWLPGRFESSYGEGLLYIALGDGVLAPVHLPPDAVLRWPIFGQKR